MKKTVSETGFKKSVDLILAYRQRAVVALAKYGADTYGKKTDKECLEIMDKQIYELQEINADWIALCKSKQGQARQLYRKQFYDDYIVKARKHRDELYCKIISEETAVEQIPSLWSLIKEWLNKIFNGK